MQRCSVSNQYNRRTFSMLLQRAARLPNWLRLLQTKRVMSLISNIKRWHNSEKFTASLGVQKEADLKWITSVPNWILYSNALSWFVIKSVKSTVNSWKLGKKTCRQQQPRSIVSHSTMPTTSQVWLSAHSTSQKIPVFDEDCPKQSFRLQARRYHQQAV